MYKKLFFSVIPVITFVIVAVGCGNGTKASALNGTWVTEEGDSEWTFNNGNWEQVFSEAFFKEAINSAQPILLENRGTYTTKGKNITFEVVQIRGYILNSQYFGKKYSDFPWCTKGQFVKTFENEARGIGSHFYIGFFDSEKLDNLFNSDTGAFAVSGNTLSLTFTDEDYETNIIKLTKIN